jgi:hypothetical protein
MVVDCLECGCKANAEKVDLLIGKSVPVYLHFLTLGVCYHLPCDVDLVGVVEHVETKVIGKVRVVYLFEWS